MKKIVDTDKLNMDQIIAYLVVGTLMLGLIGYGYLGIYNRFWADDWCYNSDFKNLGFFETMNGYNYITTYASNRYSLTLFSGLLYYLGVFGVQIMTPLNLLLWFVGIIWSLTSAKKIFDLPIHPMIIFSIALISIYFSLYAAPNLFQSVYWRSGVLPYGEPIVIGTLLFGLLFHQVTLKKSSIPLMVCSLLLAFITGGFSEAASAVLTTAAILSLIFVLVYRKEKWAQRMLPITVGILIAALASTAVLIISPTNSQRLGRFYGEQADLFSFIRSTSFFSFDFIKYSFLDTPLPHLAIAAVSGLLSYVFSESGAKRLDRKQVILVILIILSISYILIASSYAPSALIEGTPPAPRTRIIPRFILTFMLVVISSLIGFLIKQSVKLRGEAILVSLLLLGTWTYTAYSVGNVYSLQEVYAVRADLWDVRTNSIEKAVEQGGKEVIVYGIDGAPVGGIRDFVSGGVGIWINHCAESYYGLDEIIVPEP